MAAFSREKGGLEKKPPENHDEYKALPPTTEDGAPRAMSPQCFLSKTVFGSIVSEEVSIFLKGG